MPTLNFPLRRIELRPPLGQSLRKLEVERKFAPTEASLALLRTNRWSTRKPTPPLRSPRFKIYTPLESTQTHDVYFDTAPAGLGSLMSQGIYVRIRNGRWEAKVRHAGGLMNSQCAEYQGYYIVSDIVGKSLEGMRRVVGGGKSWIPDTVGPVAQFMTKREKWDIEGFEVVVDETDFGHRVGEVELCEWVERHGDEASDGEFEKEVEFVGNEMNREIERFMWRHHGVFPREDGKKRVMGKLEAYFAWKKGIEKA